MGLLLRTKRHTATDKQIQVLVAAVNRHMPATPSRCCRLETRPHEIDHSGYVPPSCSERLRHGQLEKSAASTPDLAAIHLLGRACGFEVSRYMWVVITRRAARQFRAVAPTDPLQTGSGGPGIRRWSNDHRKLIVGDTHA